MRKIDLAKQQVGLTDLLALAKSEPVLLLTSDGQEFMLAEADDFDAEVESLRANPAFQEFLSQRASVSEGIPLDEVEREIDALLAR